MKIEMGRRSRLRMLFVLFCVQITVAQVPANLKQKMWEKANECYSMFEDVDDDGEVDCDLVDDTSNGYLSMSGWWPTCGCGCSSTVGAYKDSKGGYTLLEQEYWKCNWVYILSSDRDLSDVLPEGFGIDVFVPGLKRSEDIQFARFYIEAEIPRHGTDTKLTIKAVPFGLYMESKDLLTYYIYEQYPEWDGDVLISKSNIKPLYNVNYFIGNIKDNETLELILKGEFDKIAEDELIKMDKISDGYGSFYSREDTRNMITEFKKTYDIYSQIQYETIALGWNKEKARFYIKEKEKCHNRISFLEFLQTAVFWSGIC